ncbi:NAD(P)H-dependent flavin oxidoreductase [uncultured Allofournierella sp.]|uniref:NAD(P)H-dependent flavin oxidoreductase n=1 Tax=uncultured Allofournierella sp. TaxID=1940258 RepID=UPI00375072A3
MKSITIRGRTLSVPILQGGMGIGVSLGGLAGAVAACGGMGTISTAVTGFNEPDFYQNPFEANLRALEREIRKAKELAGGAGMVAINAMVATTQYADSIRTAIRAGVDAVVCGAGLAVDLPAIADGADVALAPIVSSPRAAATLCKLWRKRFDRLPDFMVVEGAQAGGHLGFSRQEVEEQTAPSLEQLVPAIRTELEGFEQKAGRAIPLFAAGGVYSGANAARLEQLGAAGVQLATRFIATHECDASQAYKDILLAAKPEDVRIVHSPVGMPGRALYSPLIQRLEQGQQQKPRRCFNCLVPCPKQDTLYCIAHALIQAVRGNWQEGLFFCGSNAGQVKKQVSVKELMDELVTEWRNATP